MGFSKAAACLGQNAVHLYSKDSEVLQEEPILTFASFARIRPGDSSHSRIRPHQHTSTKAKTTTSSANMINRPGLPSFQRFSLNSGSPVPMARNTAVVPNVTTASTCSPAKTSGDWRVAGDNEMRQLRSSNVVLIERMLRNHQPHDVLNHVPENTDWRSKTFKLAVKIERLMFKAAKSRADYLNEHTLHRRVKVLCRYLVRIRMRKNAVVEGITKNC